MTIARLAAVVPGAVEGTRMKGTVVRTGRRVSCENGGGGECRNRVTIVIGMGFSPIFLCEKHGTEALRRRGLAVPELDLIAWAESQDPRKAK